MSCNAVHRRAHLAPHRKWIGTNTSRLDSYRHSDCHVIVTLLQNYSQEETPAASALLYFSLHNVTPHAPNRVNFFGSWRYITISCSSSLASSIPTTSSKDLSDCSACLTFEDMPILEATLCAFWRQQAVVALYHFPILCLKLVEIITGFHG